MSVLQLQDEINEESMVTLQGRFSERIFERVDDPVPQIWDSVELVNLTPREHVHRRIADHVEVPMLLDAWVSTRREQFRTRRGARVREPCPE